MMGILVAILKFCLPQWLLEAWNKIVETTGGSAIKNPPANAGDRDSIPVLGRSRRGENGNPFQYSCQENPVDRGAWQSIGLQRVGQVEALLSLEEQAARVCDT